MEPLPGILTVSELTSQIKMMLEENFRYINLIGEISNFKIHSQSGHYYFTLKDESSQVQSVMWRTRNEQLLFTPEDGMQVVIKGRITVYGARGSYQVEVWDIKPQGIGELQLRFEKLKQKLFEEGLFDESIKKPLPQFPENAAIITSRTGAVLQDFIKIARRRYPVLNLFLYPSTMQGNTSAESVIKALKDLEKYSGKKNFPKFDMIIIARGGGSIEDLWPFNDEKLARAVHSCKIPVVSAIGHEVDFTICDFVADLRAPTPSAAAELITPDMKELIENLDKFSYFYRTFVQNKLDSFRSSVNEIKGSYYFNRPKDLISNFYLRLDEMSKQFVNLAEDKVSFLKNQIRHINTTLHHISPSNNLRKGYAMISHGGAQQGLFDEGKLVTRAKELSKNDDVEIKFYDNKKLAKIIK
jgi:exodeoxyribonuclease VII large subunit